MNVSYLSWLCIIVLAVECKRFPKPSPVLLVNCFCNKRFLRTTFTIFCSTEQSSHEDDSYSRSKSSEENRIDYFERTRISIQKVIRSSWSTVKQLGKELAPGTLQNCEDELRKATSLLVLATVRRHLYFMPKYKLQYKITPLIIM